MDLQHQQVALPYFHEVVAPLMRSQRQALAEHNVEVDDSWAHVLGRCGWEGRHYYHRWYHCHSWRMRAALLSFRRVQSDAILFNSAMLLLRHWTHK
jgi:hypothetical protein